MFDKSELKLITNTLMKLRDMTLIQWVEASGRDNRRTTQGQSVDGPLFSDEVAEVLDLEPTFIG